MKGDHNEIHRNPDEITERRTDQGRDQGNNQETGDTGKVEEWYSRILPQVEEDFKEKGKLEEWYAKLWTLGANSKSGKDEFYYVPILESQEKLPAHMAAVKKVAKDVKADSAMIIFKRIHMEHDEEAEFDVKNQESIEMFFEAFGFARRYLWDIARESGKLPWLINGREDKTYVGGNLLDFIDFE